MTNPIPITGIIVTCRRYAGASASASVCLPKLPPSGITVSPGGLSGSECAIIPFPFVNTITVPDDGASRRNGFVSQSAEVTTEMSDHSCMPTAHDCALRISPILRRFLGSMRNKRKIFANRINTDHRTLDSYVYGKKTPPVEKLVVLMAECQDLCDEVMALVAEVRESRSKQR